MENKTSVAGLIKEDVMNTLDQCTTTCVERHRPALLLILEKQAIDAGLSNTYCRPQLLRCIIAAAIANISAEYLAKEYQMDLLTREVEEP